MKTLIKLLVYSLLLSVAQAQPSTKLDVQWDPVPVLNTNNLGYRVYYAAKDEPLVLKTVEVQTPFASITNLVPGKTYTLFVTAYWLGSQLESLPSEIITYKLPDVDVQVPVLPVPSELTLLNLSLHPGNVYRIQLSFTTAASTNVAGYRVTVAGPRTTNVMDTLNRSVTIVGLSNNVPYSLSVLAYDLAGNTSESASIPLRHSIATNWVGNVRYKSSTVSIGQP